MASSIPTLKEELELSRNIAEEISKIVDLKKDPALLTQASAILSVERKILATQKDAKGNLTEEAKLEKKVLDARATIINRLKTGNAVTKESLVKMIEAKANLAAFTKLQADNLAKTNSIKAGWLSLAGNAGIGGVLTKSRELFGMLKANPMLLVATIVLDLFKQVLNVFKKLDDASWEFRKVMGATRPFTKKISEDAKAAAIEFANVGLTAKNFYDSQVAVASVIGTTQGVTKEMGIDMALMAAQVGVAEKTSAEFLKTMGMIGRTTMEAQRNMLYFTQYASDVSGTNLSDVMDDVAKASSNSLRFLSRTPIQLIKAAIEAKKLGTSLQSTAKSAESLVDFQKSVAAEMEASVLMGESLNLQRARELAYAGDNVGLQKELLRLAKESNFDRRDLFTKQAIATALGKSVEEVQSMLQADRERAKIQDAINKDPSLKARQKLQDDIAKATASQAKDYAEIARQQLATQANQTRIMGITQSWNKIVMQLSERFLPYIDEILGFIANNLGTVLAISIPIVGAFFRMGKGLSYVGKFVGYIGAAKNWTWVTNLGLRMTSVGNTLGKLTGNVARLSGFSSGILKTLGGWATKIFKMLAPLFFVINIWKEIRKILNDPVLMGTKGFLAFNGKLILRAIGAVTRALWTTINDLFFGLPGAIVKGLASAGNAIFGAIAKPFKDFWGWLGKWFLGQSPSTLGLLIVKGLEAVQTMLVNLLISPFKMAWNIIKDIPFVGGLFKNIGTAVGNVVRPTVTADKVTTTPDSAIRANDIKATITPSNEEILKKLDMVVVAIDKLTAGFANGNLRATVSIDSQRIDVATGRALEFRGALT